MIRSTSDHATEIDRQRSRNVPDLEPHFQQQAEELAAANTRRTPEQAAWVDQIRSDPHWRHIEHRGFTNDRTDTEDRAAYDHRAAEQTGVAQAAPRDFHGEQQYAEELEAGRRQIETADRNARFFAQVAEQQGTLRRR